MSQPTPNYQDYLPRPSEGTETTTWPVMDFPFENNPIPDVYARTLERHYDINPQGYIPNNATVASYRNNIGPSTDFTGLGSGMTVTVNQLANPWNGETTVDKALETATTAPHFVSITAMGIWTGGAASLWAIVRGGLGRDWVYLITDDGAYAFFNLTTGKVGTVSGGTSSILELGNGDYIIELRWVSTNPGGCRVHSAPADNDTTNFIGVITKGFYIAQLQLELAASRGPLIITGPGNTARTVNVPYVDGIQNVSAPGADPFAFLVRETPPNNITKATAQVNRTYARIPAPQIYPGSKPITRPVMDNIFSVSTYAVSFDDGKTSHLFTSRKSVGSIGALTLGTTPIAQAFNTLPATTITFTDSAGTGLGIAANAGATAIRAALTAAYPATMVNFIVGATNNSVVISWTNGTGYMKTIDLPTSAAKLDWTPGSTSISIVSADTNTEAPNQDPSIRTINCTGHGASAAGTRVAFWNGNSLVARSVVMTIPDANSFTVLASDVDGKDLVLTHCAFTEDASVCYAISPTVTCTVRRTQSFYLPGYSLLASGATMATFADIPLQTPKMDAQGFLDAIVAGSAWVVEDAGGIQPWMGPILSQEVSEVQMSDALDSVSVLP